MNDKTQHIFFRNPARRRQAFGSLLLFTLFCTGSLQGQNYPSREDQVKAVFLFNFTQFVEWPATAFNGPGSDFVIGIVGKDPFGSYLDETVQGEKMMDHPLKVRRFTDVKEIQHCHLLFIGEEDPQKIRGILSVLTRRNILTVSDSTGFATSGGMIRFFTKDNKTKLQINPSVAKAAELNISSKLLRVAEIIE